MGDFYEVFFEDAEKTSKILNIALTHRGKIGDTAIPMAGIPHHAASAYIDKITQAGEKVAICEQTQDPKDAKGIVERAVTQVVSPGIPYDLEKSEENRNHFIFSFAFIGEKFHLAFLDFTTGDFIGFQMTDEAQVIDKVKSFAPKECIAYFDQFENFPNLSQCLENLKVLTTHLSSEYFEEKFTSAYIKKIIPHYQKDKVLKSESSFIAPIGSLCYYIISTQNEESFSHIKPFRFLNTLNKMKISYQTLSSLEIFPRSQETYSNSLISLMDKTKSSMGRRMLKVVAQAPLNDPKAIEKRLELSEYLLKNFEKLEFLRTELGNIRDIPRILAKLSTKKIQGHDLINLYRGLEIFEKIQKEVDVLLDYCHHNLPEDSLKKAKSLRKLIQKSISEEIGANLQKGNLIKEGYSKERDELANINDKVAEKLKKLEKKFRDKYDIPTLKIKSNNINGYFVEVSKNQARKVPESFRRKQTLVNSERFLCTELEKIENDLITAHDKLTKIERKIFKKVTDQVENLCSALHEISDWVAQVDVFQSFAWFASQYNLIRPQLINGKEIDIKGAWHPLIKSMIKDEFVAHDIHLTKDHFFALITGPNMAGKTTVMREVAIIQFLTQLGCFVPAESVKISLCDFIFSRIGASDDIVGGQSTFMVEMSETSEIIRHASEDSLVILDEIGRGTSTYDGLSLAWSLLEHFVNKIQCRTLFSTHYHELIDVAEQIQGAKNFTVKTKNTNGTIQFLYELIEGGATQSFGLNVAKLAGLPSPVLRRAQKILTMLEEKESLQSHQMDIFSSSTESITSELEEEFKSINPDELSPREALDKLYELQTFLQ